MKIAVGAFGVGEDRIIGAAAAGGRRGEGIGGTAGRAAVLTAALQASTVLSAWSRAIAGAAWPGLHDWR
ncbi:MAG: hypothetical protein LBU64_02655 [Planctomycetota bacterium]|nr:hypothetical protein [Planctomycetota bacterium]